MPGVDAGDFNMFFHTDAETPETVPWTGLEASTRAYAKIIEGKMEKNLYAQKCLLNMPYPKEDEFKGNYGDFIKSKVAKLKENIVLRRFVRMEVGK